MYTYGVCMYTCIGACGVCIVDTLVIMCDWYAGML